MKQESPLLTASGRKSSNQIIAFAREDLPYMGDVAIASPSPPLQRQAGGGRLDGEQRGDFGIGVYGGDAVLSLGPGHMVEQPGEGLGLPLF